MTRTAVSALRIAGIYMRQTGTSVILASDALESMSAAIPKMVRDIVAVTPMAEIVSSSWDDDRLLMKDILAVLWQRCPEHKEATVSCPACEIYS
jgi:hypothetical protein